MKKSKLAFLAGVTVASALFLASCGSSAKSSQTNTFSYVFSTDPDSLNYLLSNRSTTSDVTTNLVDGLFENDQYGNLVPALAENWSVSKDGLTYTYKLRKDAKWYDSEGNEYADVTAQDFVTSLVKTRTSLKLVSKPLMTIPSNTLWLNLNPSGILN